mmetsp:Transcript_38977/g.79794  ORF Transcript_38977/g.79794 Transcript_38977/m.79794 type:complete len:86 (+) Transcript_38977:984-1241(+)
MFLKKFVQTEPVGRPFFESIFSELQIQEFLKKYFLLKILRHLKFYYSRKVFFLFQVKFLLIIWIRLVYYVFTVQYTKIFTLTQSC